MKNLSNPRKQNPFTSTKSMNSQVPPQISRGAFENVRLGGRNVGASMILDGGGGGGGGSGESPGSCSINIYINNDIQGINNSVLIGSEVKMGDLGVSLILEDLKMDRGVRLVSRTKESDSVAFWMLFALVLVFISLLVYAIV